MIQFFILYSRQGKVRLAKYYSDPTSAASEKLFFSSKQKANLIREVTSEMLLRKGKNCNFIELANRDDLIVVYKRFAGLYFILGITKSSFDNELIALETIQHFVETLDQYFGNVCELDLIFCFDKAYHVLDELILGGFVQEPRKGVALNSISKQDALENVYE